MSVIRQAYEFELYGKGGPPPENFGKIFAEL